MISLVSNLSQKRKLKKISYERSNVQELYLYCMINDHKLYILYSVQKEKNSNL